MRVREARKLEASTRDTAPPASKIDVIVNVDSSIMMASLSLSSYRAHLDWFITTIRTNVF